MGIKLSVMSESSVLSPTKILAHHLLATLIRHFQNCVAPCSKCSQPLTFPCRSHAEKFVGEQGWEFDDSLENGKMWF